MKSFSVFGALPLKTEVLFIHGIRWELAVCLEQGRGGAPWLAPSSPSGFPRGSPSPPRSLHFSLARPPAFLTSLSLIWNYLYLFIYVFFLFLVPHGCLSFSPLRPHHLAQYPENQLQNQAMICRAQCKKEIVGAPVQKVLTITRQQRMTSNVGHFWAWDPGGLHWSYAHYC